jgi:hypothetical protein
MAYFQAGQVLVLPEVPDLIQGHQERKRRRDPVHDRLFQFSGKTALNPEIEYQVVSRIGYDNIGYSWLVSPGQGGQGHP